MSLASFLLLDGFKDDYELSIVVTNDSDLVTPIELVRTDLNLRVGVLNPHRNMSWALKGVADFYRPIRKGPLSASLFPDALTDPNGIIAKPSGW